MAINRVKNILLILFLAGVWLYLGSIAFPEYLTTDDWKFIERSM